MKNTDLYGYAYDFSVDCDSMDIHKWLIKQVFTYCVIELGRYLAKKCVIK